MNTRLAILTVLRWSHIVVHHVKTKERELDVFFLATETGRLQKVVNMPSPISSLEPTTSCLVEDIKIVQNGKPRPVKNMKLSLSKVGNLSTATWNLH